MKQAQMNIMETNEQTISNNVVIMCFQYVWGLTGFKIFVGAFVLFCILSHLTEEPLKETPKQSYTYQKTSEFEKLQMQRKYEQRARLYKQRASFDDEVTFKVKRNYGYRKEYYDVEITKQPNGVNQEDIDAMVQEALDFNMD
jgi:hypothetical protein